MKTIAFICILLVSIIVEAKSPKTIMYVEGNKAYDPKIAKTAHLDEVKFSDFAFNYDKFACLPEKFYYDDVIYYDLQYVQHPSYGGPKKLLVIEGKEYEVQTSNSVSYHDGVARSHFNYFQTFAWNNHADCMAGKPADRYITGYTPRLANCTYCGNSYTPFRIGWSTTTDKVFIYDDIFRSFGHGRITEWYP